MSMVLIDKELLRADGECFSFNVLNHKTTELMVEKAFSEYFEAAIQRVLEAGKFDTVILPTCGKFWAEVDFEEDYRRAEKLIKD